MLEHGDLLEQIKVERAEKGKAGEKTKAEG